MCNKPKIGNLQKRGDGRWRVVLTTRPIAYLIQCCRHIRVRPEKETFASFFGPLRELVPPDTQFVGHFLDACRLSCQVRMN